MAGRLEPDGVQTEGPAGVIVDRGSAERTLGQETAFPGGSSDRLGAWTVQRNILDYL